MKRTNWDEVAENQFKSLSKDIQEDWGDLYTLTSRRHEQE